MSYVTAEQVEYWILQSTNPTTNPQVQWQASQQLQEWIHLATTTTTTTTAGTAPLPSSNSNNNNEEHRACVARICFELLVSNQSKKYSIPVRFAALTTLGRIPLNVRERQQVRHYLLHQFMLASSSSSSTSLSISNNSNDNHEAIIPPFFRNKAAMILVKYILQDVGAEGGTSNTAATITHTPQQPSAWPTIREDLVQLAETFPSLFLKTVETLLEEFVMAHEEPSIAASEQQQQQSQQSQQRTTHNFDRESMRRVKDVLKGYYHHNQQPKLSSQQQQTSSSSSSTTLLQCLFECTVTILRNAVVVAAAASASSSSTNSSSSSAEAAMMIAIHVLALDTVKTFFQWTGDLSFLDCNSSSSASADGASSSSTNVVDGCLELLLQSIQPARFPNNSSIQLSAWKAWQEWMTIVVSSSMILPVPSPSATTTIITRNSSSDMLGESDDDDEMAVVLQQQQQEQQQEQQMKKKKMAVMMALLERIHEYDILPFQGGESTVVEIEVVIEVAKLITTFGLDMISVWEGNENDATTAVGEQQASALVERQQQIDTLFHQVLDLFFRAFAYDDIDVSGAVLPLATRFALSIMSVSTTTTASATKRRGSNGQTQQDEAQQPPHLLLLLQQQMPKFLNIVYQQVKYDPDFGYDFENEDNAEEEMYRTQLIKVYNKLVLAAPDICLQFVCEATRQQIIDNNNDVNVSNTSDHSSSTSSSTTTTQDVEATLRLLYHYCEGIRPPPGMKTVMRNPAFVSLLFGLHSQSDVIFAKYAHREVLCLYYETAVRYYPIYLQPQPTNGDSSQQVDTAHLLAKLLESLSGPCGLQHPHARVRSRCSYLLLRLVKAVVNRLRPLVETAVSGIQTLLSSNVTSDLLRPEDTLYLFETIGLLLGKTGLEAHEQQQYLAQVMTPHVRSIGQVLATPGLLSDVDHYGEILSNSVAAIAFLSKGFAKRPPEEVQIVLVEAVNITLRVLEAMPMSEPVRNKTMIFVQRMIQCIGRKLLVKIPDYLRFLIEHCTSEDVLFVAQIFNQLCIKFKEDAAPAIDTSLLPFLRKCQTLAPATADIAQSTSGGIVAPHLETEKLAIQKLAFIVLHHIVTHNATAVLLSPTNAASLESVLQTVSEGAILVHEPAVKKTCIKFFREITYQWTMPNAATGINDNYRRGLVTFVCQTIVPGVLMSMMHDSFDERDAQQYRNVSELANIMLLIKERTGDVETMLTALNATGRLPAVAIDGLRTASDVKSIVAALGPMFQLKRSART